MHTYKITFIGAGNVAYHLAQDLFDAGYPINQVYSRNKANAEILASFVDAKAINDLKNITPDADVYIIAVNDDAIEEVASALPLEGKIILHTSASVPTIPVKNSSNHFGVLYPLQTFSKLVPVDLRNVPFFIDGENGEVKKTARDIASVLTNHVHEADADKRLALHVAAVFANNFTNYMMILAEQVIKKKGFNFDLLKPLLEMTYEKVKLQKPHEVQTGPALREDRTTILKHEEYLKNDEDLLKIYKILTEGIKELKQKK